MIDTEQMMHAARRAEAAAEAMSMAASRMEEALQRMTFLLENGYGNNVERLIQLLEAMDTLERVEGTKNGP